MKNDKLEDIKVVSTVAFVLSLTFTIILFASELDSIRTGAASLWFLDIICGICSLISLTVSIISSRILKKRQGKDYFSTLMYIEAFIELFCPSLLPSYRNSLKNLKVSKDNQETRLWKTLCVGYDKARVIIFILWFILWASCVWMLIRSIFFLNNENKIFDIVTFSICVVALLFILIFVATEIKIDPMPIFDCIELTKVEFNELAQHFDNAVKIMQDTWMDSEYLFILAKGKSYCIPIKDYEEMSITPNRFGQYVMILSSKHECVVKSSLFPFGFQKLKIMLETYHNP